MKLCFPIDESIKPNIKLLLRKNDYDENDGLYLPNNYRWWYIEELNQKKNDLFDVVFKWTSITSIFKWFFLFYTLKTFLEIQLLSNKWMAIYRIVDINY